MKPSYRSTASSSHASDVRLAPVTNVASALSHALGSIRLATGVGPDLRIDLPTGDAPRMRNLVHRGTQRPVFKVPSVKLDRVVQCESILEYEATLLLDVSPNVTSFSEQPARIHYMLEGTWRSHIPDFAALAVSQKAFLEIKFEKDIDDEVRERTAFLKDALARIGWEYHLLTEGHLRQGSVVTNALGVLRRARHANCAVASLQIHERLRQGAGHTLGNYGWKAAGSTEAVHLAQLIMSGHAAVDMLQPLTDDSKVWAAESNTSTGGAAWLPALSA